MTYYFNGPSNLMELSIWWNFHFDGTFNFEKISLKNFQWWPTVGQTDRQTDRQTYMKM